MRSTGRWCATHQPTQEGYEALQNADHSWVLAGRKDMVERIVEFVDRAVRVERIKLVVKAWI